jgi:hypothetical protein
MPPGVPPPPFGPRILMPTIADAAGSEVPFAYGAAVN